MNIIADKKCGFREFSYSPIEVLCQGSEQSSLDFIRNHCFKAGIKSFISAINRAVSRSKKPLVLRQNVTLGLNSLSKFSI